MIDFVRTRADRDRRVMLLTEASLADNIAAGAPDIDFVGPYNLSLGMKRITLPKILDSLISMTGEVVVDPGIAARVRTPIERMLHLSM